MDEDYVYALQASARARMGGARWWKVFLLKRRAKARRHAHMAAFDCVGPAGSLLLPSLLTSLSFSFLFFK